MIGILKGVPRLNPKPPGPESLKNDGWKTTILLGRPQFSGAFRECIFFSSRCAFLWLADVCFFLGPICDRLKPSIKQQICLSKTNVPDIFFRDHEITHRVDENNINS